MVFPTKSTKLAQRMEIEYVVSGWTSEQIEQFLNFAADLSPDATITILNSADANPSSADDGNNSLKLVAKIRNLTTNEELGGGETVRVINGDDYRSIRLEMSSNDVLGYL